MRCTSVSVQEATKAMGTLSKRGLRELGFDVNEHRLQEFRSRIQRMPDVIRSRISAADPRHEITGAIARVMNLLPSTTWLGLAGASAVGAIGLAFARRPKIATALAVLVPTFLVLGLHDEVAGTRDDDRADMH